MEDFMKNVYISDHPLVVHKVTHLCDVTTGYKEFNEITNEIAMILGAEALKDVKMKSVEIQAPLSKFESNVIDTQVIVAPILRAGVGMVDGIRKLYPKTQVGHIGLYRDEETLLPQKYYFKMPPKKDDSVVLIVDPALATGGSAEAAIQFVKDAGFNNIKFLCLIASPTGIKKVHDKHPEVPIYVAKYADAPLNEKGYIMTAFGDAGDRVFGTY